MKVYLNGAFLPLAEAKISVMDRGFLFGDGVYEVIPAYAGRLFRLQHHLQRLNQSLNGIRMSNPLSSAEWEAVLKQLVSQRPDEDLSVYLQVTRGVSAKRDHRIPHDIEPTLFAMASPMGSPDPRLAEAGIAAITLDDLRWKLCNIKAITLLGNVLLKQTAADRDCLEAILIRDGLALEGAASNLFVIEDGVIVTPPKSCFLLPGITRDLVLEMATEQKLPFREEEIAADRLRSADEIWLTSSTKEIMPVTRLDDRPVGGGIPGPVFKRVAALYAARKPHLRTENT